MTTRDSRFVDPCLLSITILTTALLALPGPDWAQEPDKRAQDKAVAPDPRGSEDDSLEIVWRTDRAAARKEARKTGKPILYYFRCDP